MKLLDTLGVNVFRSWEADGSATVLTVIKSRSMLLLNFFDPYLGSACIQLSTDEGKGIAQLLNSAVHEPKRTFTQPDSDSGLVIRLTRAIAGEPYREGVRFSLGSVGDDIDVQMEMTDETALMLAQALAGTGQPGITRVE